MDKFEMEDAMIKNIVEKTGKTLKEWIKIIKEKNLEKNKDVVNFLKKEYSVGHFYAHLIVKKSK
tara:strand:+ start:862 stop:1053 length:192 start_codon:yes stop_codon:yes gene_type:complete